MPPDDDGVPDFAAARDQVVDALVTFATALRREGGEVPADACITAGRALVEVGFDDEDIARAALRSALVSRKEDLPAFDRLFPLFWNQLVTGIERQLADEPDRPEESDGDVAPTLGSPDAADLDPAADGADADDGAERGPIETTMVAAPTDDGAAEGGDVTASVYSPAGRPRPVGATPDLRRGVDELDRALGRLTRTLATLRGRRWSGGDDERVDPRVAMRRSFGTGGTVLDLPSRSREHAAVRATLLVDVSQSVLDTIDRGFLIRMLRLASARWRRVRVFFFDTSVQEVTEPFDAPTSADALAALERAETAWGGGTRIGRALEAVRSTHPEAVDRDTVVLVISDGLEVGEIDVLESGMSWLSRRAGAVLWLNPLAASPEYEPTCRGMAAALPYVDGVFAFAGPDDVSELARQLEQRGVGGRLGYEYDPRRPRATG